VDERLLPAALREPDGLRLRRARPAA